MRPGVLPGFREGTTQLFATVAAGKQVGWPGRWGWLHELIGSNLVV